MSIIAIFESEDIVVYGQPETIQLVTDIGAAGPRGSMIYSNIGHPDDRTTNTSGVYTVNGETLRTNDFYFRVDNNSFYQWVNLPTGPVWQSRAGFNNYFRTLTTLNFVSGEASATIPLADLWVDTGIQDILATSICVVITPVSTQGAFVTIMSKSLDVSVPRNLLLDFFGFTVDALTYVNSPLVGEIELDITVSLLS